MPERFTMGTFPGGSSKSIPYPIDALQEQTVQTETQPRPRLRLSIIGDWIHAHLPAGLCVRLRQAHAGIEEIEQAHGPKGMSRARREYFEFLMDGLSDFDLYILLWHIRYLKLRGAIGRINDLVRYGWLYFWLDEPKGG